MNISKDNYGFKHSTGGVHTSRTMMLAELQNLLAYVGNPNATLEEYSRAIVVDNCLRKPSGKSRELTRRHLIELYTLDASIVLFQGLLYLWSRDKQAQAQIAFLCALARDPLLKSCNQFILSCTPGQRVQRIQLEKYIEKANPGRFSPATLTSVAQNINSTWTQTGLVEGRIRKTRVSASPTVGGVVYALLLGHLLGMRGEVLFENKYLQVLNCSPALALDYADEAARKCGCVLSESVKLLKFPSRKLFPNNETVTMSKIDILLNNYTEFISTPWRDAAPAQRVIFCVYDPLDEKLMQAKIGDFELATRHSDHSWFEYNIVGLFEKWLTAEKYADTYYSNPDLLSTITPQYLKYIVETYKANTHDKDINKNTLVALNGVGTLFGVLKVKELVDALSPLVPGRLMVFFPGSFENNNYRLLDAYDGWNYLAIAITAEKSI